MRTANSVAISSDRSLARPYAEIGAGSVCSVNGGPDDPAYTPPAEEARKNPLPVGRGSQRVRKPSSTAISASSSAWLLPTTPAPAHQYASQPCGQLLGGAQQRLDGGGRVVPRHVGGPEPAVLRDQATAHRAAEQPGGADHPGSQLAGALRRRRRPRGPSAGSWVIR